MNSRERILTAYRCGEADRVPCGPFVTPAMVALMTPSEWDSLLRQTDVTMSVGVLTDFEIVGGRYWQEHATVRRQGAARLTEVQTPQGALRMAQTLLDQEQWTSEYLGKSEADLARWLSIPYEPPAFELARYHEWVARVGHEGLVMLGVPDAFRFCLGFFGPEMLYLHMADDLAQIERLVALCCERVAAYLSACCAQGVRHFWMGGSEHCGPGVVRPALFRRLVTPYDRQLVALIHANGGTVNQHMHGRLKDLLDDIVEIGSDVLSPIESGLRGDVTLAEAKSRLAGRVCIKGNLDDMAFLAVEPQEVIRSAAEDAIAQAAAGGGFILSGTDAGIYSPYWVQSTLTMAEVARRHSYKRS